MSYDEETWVNNAGPPFLGASSMNKFEAAHELADDFMTASGAVIANHEVRVTVIEGKIVTLTPLASGGQHMLGASALMTDTLASAVPGMLYIASGTVAQPTVNAPLYRSDGTTFRKVAPGIIPVVQNLPTNPNDGDEVYFLADATNGVMWHLRYRASASGTFKWDYIGGPPVVTAALGDMTNTNSAMTVLTNGPTLSTLLAGDYTLGLRIIFVVSGATPSIAQAAVFRGGVQGPGIGAVIGQTVAYGLGRATGLAKGDTVDVRCANANSVSTRYVQAAIDMVPIRVG